MPRRLLMLVLLIHSAISFYVLRETGYWSAFPPFEGLYVYQIFSDLGASLAILLLIFGAELKRQRKSMKPLILVGLGMVFVGSFAPMTYLLIEQELFI